MNIPDLSALKDIYNSTIYKLLDKNGFGVPCDIVYKSTKKTQCYNCFYDPISKKSANKFKQLNSVNYQSAATWLSPAGGLVTVGTSGKPSAYGTYDQSGNCWEWLDTTAFLNFKVCRAGAWNSTSNIQISKTSRGFSNANSQNEVIGFRVCSTTNPLNHSSFVPVSSPLSNSPDVTGYGQVSYSYMIGKHEVTNAEYCVFLNSIAKTDTYNLYSPLMQSSINGGIVRSGSSGNYTYSTKLNMGNKPVVLVSWFDAARFCNWLHNGKTSSSSTETGAYTLNGGYPLVIKNSSANYWLPRENEWYKAAFFKNDGTNNYWTYATQNNNPPSTVDTNQFGDGDGIGPVSFAPNQICPVCLGTGSTENTAKENIYLTVIFDYKNFINRLNNVNIVEGYIQTICSIEYYSKLKKCSEIIVDSNLTNLTQNIYVRDSEPTPVGLGDNKFIFTNWKRKQ